MSTFSSHNLKRKFTAKSTAPKRGMMKKFKNTPIAIVNAAVDESFMLEEESSEDILPDIQRNPLHIDEPVIKFEIEDQAMGSLKPSEASKSNRPLITSTSDAVQSNLLEPTLVNVHALLINILKRVEVIEQNLNKTNCFLEKVTKNIIINDNDDNVVIFKHYNFPLQKDSDVEEFNKLLSNSKAVLEDFQNYIQYLMRSAHPNNLPQIFSKIISDEALLSFNWSGTKNKKSYIGNTTLCNTIFDSIKCNDFGFSEYETIIKTIIKMSHGRIHSLNFRKREKDKYITSLY